MHQYLDALIQDDDEDHEAFYRRSKLYFEEQQNTKALNDISLAIKQAPDNQVYLIHQAKIYATLDQHHKVLRVLSKVKDENKTTELLRIELVAGVKTGKLKDPESIAAAMRGLKLKQGQEDYLLGMIAWDKGDTLLAKQKLANTYRSGEKGEDVLLTLAKTYQGSNQEKETALLYEAAVKYKSKHSRILLANNFLRNKEPIREDSLYEVMLHDHPKDYEVLLRRANLYHAQGKYAELVTLLEDQYKNTKTMEDDFILADAYFSLRKNDEASKMYVLLEPLDTTGQITKNVNIIKWRKAQERLRNLPDSLRTITKDSVNSTP